MPKRTVLLAIAIAFIALVVARPASAQHSRWHSQDSRMYFDYGDPFMVSVIQSPDGRTADVRLTTANSMFSFLHSNNGYFAIRNVTIEVGEDGSPTLIASKNFLDTLYAATFQETTSKTTWHAIDELVPIASLDSGKHYLLHLTIRDEMDGMVYRAQPFALRAPVFSNTATSSGIAIGDIQLADSSDGNTYYTSALGNTYMFSKNVTGTVSFRIAPALGANPTVEINVRQLTNAIDPSDTGERYHAELDASDLYRAKNLVGASADSLLRYHFTPVADSDLWIAVFHVPGEKFEQGKYEFSVKIRAGATIPRAEQTQVNNFNLVWQNMPLSLEDPTDAIEPLAVIATPPQIKHLSSGSKQEMTEKLYDFWRKQDPTPATAYNERMATFYQRVDYADFNFATGSILNGAMTDRGKVYLLYGAPTTIERSFIPGEVPTETWSYDNNVSRVFQFADQDGQGKYQLTNIQPLSNREKR